MREKVRETSQAAASQPDMGGAGKSDTQKGREIRSPKATGR